MNKPGPGSAPDFTFFLLGSLGDGALHGVFGWANFAGLLSMVLLTDCFQRLVEEVFRLCSGFVSRPLVLQAQKSFGWVLFPDFLCQLSLVSGAYSLGYFGAFIWLGILNGLFSKSSFVFWGRLSIGLF